MTWSTVTADVAKTWSYLTSAQESWTSFGSNTTARNYSRFLLRQNINDSEGGVDFHWLICVNPYFVVVSLAPIMLISSTPTNDP